MNFNSIEYAIFLPLVFIIYWYALGNRLRLQNLFLLAVSYLFYGWWDWRFLLLIVATTLSTYLTAIAASASVSRAGARRWTALNIVLNLGILVTFKYFNFFGENLTRLFNLFGVALDWVTVDILLPVGISFYTFQAISYSIDVYRRDIPATRDIIGFATFVAFFPQLVAGPIERATQLLPQILAPRRWDYGEAVIGMRQILWGLAKKIAIADFCGSYATRIFSQPDYYSGSTLLLGAILFSFQIYGDFSGYSDIAQGSARLLGVRLMDNFRYPYQATSVADFWRRWHISLMTWLRDYVYIPLGGSRHGMDRTIVNIAVVFLLSGLWHGASWTFVLWGAWWALLMIAERLSGRVHRPLPADSSLRQLPRMILVFVLATIGWLIFRSQSVSELCTIVSKICSPSLLEWATGFTPLVAVAILLVVEWVGRRSSFPIERLPMPVWCRWAIYWVLLGVILWTTEDESAQFIYFQF
ncbi:MAG: MBOAT family protein [Pseudoflavonifractor sp.]|nr:MBOAT family protein [Pseudoflavonifractor sp.]